MSSPVPFLQHRRKHFRAVGTDLTSGLKAMWRLEEDVGSFLDSTGRGNDLTRTGTVTRVAGQVGHAQDFAPSPIGTAYRNNGGDIDFSGAFTFALWFRLVTAAGGSVQFVSKRDNTGIIPTSVNAEFFMGIGSSHLACVVPGHNCGFFFPTGLGINILGQWFPNPGDWYHFVVVWKNGLYDLPEGYINGIPLVHAFDGPGTPVGLTGPLVFGPLVGSGAVDAVDLDEGALWSRAFTPTEVVYLFNHGLPGLGDVASNLIAAWHLEENGGPYADSTGRGNTLTKTGTVTRVTGNTNYGQDVTASGGYMSRASGGDIVFNTTFSMGMWVKWVARTGTNYIVQKTTGGPGFLIRENSGTVTVTVSGWSADFPFTPTAGKWYHLCVTSVPGVAMKFYVNGVEIAPSSSASSASGTNPNPLFFLNGCADEITIDEIALFARELAALDVAKLCSVGF